MSTNISDLFASIPGLKADYKTDWIDNAKADWKIDWDAVPGGAAGAAPTCSVLPVITGSPAVGQTLSVSAGTWAGNPAPTLTYKWYVDGNLAPVTTSSYVVDVGDVGLMVHATVTGTNSQGSAVATAVAVGPVTA